MKIRLNNTQNQRLSLAAEVKKINTDSPHKIEEIPKAKEGLLTERLSILRRAATSNRILLNQEEDK